MDRRRFLKWGSFLTVSVATAGLAGCGSDDDDNDAGGGEARLSFPQGVASGDPRPDSIVLWTRVEGQPGAVPVTVQFAADEAFTQVLVNETVNAEEDWDHTVRHKVTGLEPGTTYYYRFRAGGATSTVGRTRTAPAEDAAVAQLKFAFISCQDWSVNHWAGFEELAAQELDFIVHLGDYVYETVNADFQSGLVEPAHAALALPDGTVRSDGAVYATTLEDYRTLYKRYRTDARLQALHARFPIIAIWDDHEFSDDCWQDRQTYDADDDAQPRTARRRSASQAWFEFMPADVTLDADNPSFQNIQIYRAFRFGTLATLLMTDERLYRADHVVPEAPVGSDIGSRYFVPKALLQNTEQAKRTAGGLDAVSILGGTQRDWWKAQLSASTTTWNLWGNEVSLLRMQFDGLQAVAKLMTDTIVQAAPPLEGAYANLFDAVAADLAAYAGTGTTAFAALDNLLDLLTVPAPQQTAILQGLQAALPPAILLNRYILNADQWDGYDAERQDLMAFVRDAGIANLVALTGDIHAFFAGPVMADFDATPLQPVMVDLVTAGISSNSFFSYFKSVVDNDPTFAPARDLIYTEAGGVVTNTFNDTLGQFNGDWLKYLDTDAQGYAVVTLTPAQLRCTFSKLKPLDGGAAPALPAVASRVELVVTAGTPDVQRVA